MKIAAAIHSHNLLSFVYDGFRRTVEPHTYGLDKKGHIALRAYQVSGGSESGEYVGWNRTNNPLIKSQTVGRHSVSCNITEAHGLLDFRGVGRVCHGNRSNRNSTRKGTRMTPAQITRAIKSCSSETVLRDTTGERGSGVLMLVIRRYSSGPTAMWTAMWQPMRGWTASPVT